MQELNHTKEEVSEAYSKLIWAQGLVNFVLHAGFDLSEENRTNNEGSLISIFSILQEYLEKSEDILCDLDNGYENRFTSIWKKKETGEAGEEEQY